jgi:hypothetical protein
MRKVVDIGGGKSHYSLQAFALFPKYFVMDDQWGIMPRNTALVFESLAEALRAKELIDAAGKPKYWLTFLDRVEHRDDGVTTRQGAGRVSGRSDEMA